MAKCTLGQLKEKEVINVCDGRRLGCVDDLEFDIESGKICAVILGMSKGFLCFGHEEEKVIGWQRIQRIGADIILVDIGPEQQCCEGIPDKQKPPSKRCWF